MNTISRTHQFIRLASFALALLITFATLSIAEASAQKCNGGSCIWVQGKSLHVDFVRGGVLLAPHAHVTGHFEVWGPSLHYNTNDRSFYNLTGGPYLMWDYTSTHYLNRNFPNNSQICTKFWVKSGQHYVGWGTSCATVHK